MILTADNRTCIGKNNKIVLFRISFVYDSAFKKKFSEDEVFLLYSRPNEIRGADLSQPYYNTVPPISVPNVFNPTELDFDASFKNVYWIDSHVKEVRRTHITGGLVESIVNTGKLS